MGRMYRTVGPGATTTWTALALFFIWLLLTENTAGNEGWGIWLITGSWLLLGIVSFHNRIVASDFGLTRGFWFGGRFIYRYGFRSWQAITGVRTEKIPGGRHPSLTVWIEALVRGGQMPPDRRAISMGPMALTPMFLGFPTVRALLGEVVRYRPDVALDDTAQRILKGEYTAWSWYRELAGPFGSYAGVALLFVMLLFLMRRMFLW